MRKIILVLMFALVGLSGNAQWSINYDFQFGVGWDGESDGFEDVTFENSNVGIYAYSTPCSPDSGPFTTDVLTTEHFQNGIQIFQQGCCNGCGGLGMFNTIGLYYGNPHSFYIEYYIGFAGFQLDKISDDGSNLFEILFTQPFIDISIPDTNNVFMLTQKNSNSVYIGKCFINNYVKKDSLVSSGNGKIFFTDSLNGFISVSDTSSPYGCHNILKSTTGGTSWSSSFHDTLFNINKLFFLSPAIGFAVGDSGKAVKTLDSGSTWQYINTNQSKTLHDVIFINDTMGYVGGDSGLIMNTINGGLTWQQQILTPLDSGNVIKFINVQPNGIYCLINGFDDYWETSTGPILYVTYPYSGVGIPKISSQPTITLFPNPFSTKAMLSIRNYESGIRNGEVQIINLLGQEVKTIPIINQKEITINRDNLAEGMYFYKIIGGNKETVAVGKMVVN